MVSIIIPTLERHQSLVKLVESIEGQQYDLQNLEVLIVYNRTPSPRHRELFRPSLPLLRVLQAPFPGANHARNTGLTAARGEILFFIDDDCVLDDPTFLNKMELRHQEQPDLMALGGPYRLPKRPTFWDRAYHANMSLWMEQQRLSPHRSRALLGGNAAYKSCVFAQGRRFTPGIRYGGSETPLNASLFEDSGPFGFYEDLGLTHQSHMSCLDFIYKASMQGRGYAELTKRVPQTLAGKNINRNHLSRQIRWALSAYSFLFMVGFRTSIHERRSSIRSLFEELASRFFKPVRHWLALWRPSKAVLRSKYDL